MPKKIQWSSVVPAGKVDSSGIRISTEPQVGRGVYSNVAVVQHTPNEFILDFLLQLAGTPQLVSRVVLSPQHAKALEKALRTNLVKYEANFGKIVLRKPKKADRP